MWLVSMFLIAIITVMPMGCSNPIEKSANEAPQKETANPYQATPEATARRFVDIVNSLPDDFNMRMLEPEYKEIGRSLYEIVWPSEKNRRARALYIVLRTYKNMSIGSMSQDTCKTDTCRIKITLSYALHGQDTPGYRPVKNFVFILKKKGANWYMYEIEDEKGIKRYQYIVDHM